MVACTLNRLVPYRFWRKALGTIDAQTTQPADEAITQLIIDKAFTVGHRVRLTASIFPFDVVFLPQAMAGRWMLSRRGVASQLFIGARRGQVPKGSDFHAWLMYGDLCLTGHHEREQFQAFGKP